MGNSAVSVTGGGFSWEASLAVDIPLTNLF